MNQETDDKLNELTGKFKKFEETQNERRKPWTDEEVEQFKSEVVESLLADLARGAIKKLLQFAGQVLVAALIGLTVAGKLDIKGLL